MDYLNPSGEILKHGQELPHWQQGEAMQFVTFRLGDSMPAGKLRLWKEERDVWQKVHPQPWSPEEEKACRDRNVATPYDNSLTHGGFRSPSGR